MWDLPLKQLFTSTYDRKSLTREYIIHTNSRLGDNAIVPNEHFQKEWENIVMKNKDSYLFLVDSPSVFAYFMEKGLITPSKYELIKEIKDKSLCFKVDSNQNVIDIKCN